MGLEQNQVVGQPALPLLKPVYNYSKYYTAKESCLLSENKSAK